MTPREFTALGKDAYGRRWKAPLARALRCSPVTVWRYSTGQTPIPWVVAQMMRNLSKAKAARRCETCGAALADD